MALTGGFAVRADGATHVVPPGGLAYLPTDASGTFLAEPGVELAFAHYPTIERSKRE